ncbi:unnamed protein product [Durusdinium trenchii]|uniref:Uncharacterized protein n=1 Tax=Durusdinium trenchii TaxID=1381693 RepID=A0ABP0KI61_9DINO
MGGCESCATGRRKEAPGTRRDAFTTPGTKRRGVRRGMATPGTYAMPSKEQLGGVRPCADKLRADSSTVDGMLSGLLRSPNFVYMNSLGAEAEGMDVLAARRLYSELAKQERQSPERAQEMLRWAASTQDGVILRQVIEEVETLCPDSVALQPARKRLAEYQEEMKRRISRTQDLQKLSFFLDRARQMGIPSAELAEHFHRIEVSLPEFRRLTGHTAVGGACLSQGLLPGCEERTISQWSPFALGNPKVETVKDLISLRCKGAIGAPWFEDRERPIAGVDLAEPGGSYQSYSMLRDHRLKHARCPNSPGVMFDQMKGPPITSYDYGFYPADIRPPRYPISSTWISRSASELQKTLKTSKGR